MAEDWFDKIFQTKEGYIHRKVAGSEVLISVGENIANFNGYIEMNPSAAFLWDKMSEPIKYQDLEAALVKEFKITADVAANDVHEFVSELMQHNMVSVI